MAATEASAFKKRCQPKVPVALQAAKYKCGNAAREFQNIFRVTIDIVYNRIK